MRMTGCPNGCARPYLSEVAFIGTAPGSYMLLLGGGYHGQRMNKIYRGILIFCNPSTALDQPTQSQIGFGDRPKYKHLLLQHL